jgi:NAD(P)-dependent dehydrogenase (short-subunit alcohol dehydrogenase family)
MQKGSPEKPIRKPQHQTKPGIEKKMSPRPIYDDPARPVTNKLQGKVALITGGDSGIGRAVAILFAKEGAEIAIAYLNEHADAKETRNVIEKNYYKKCQLIPGDLGKEKHCRDVIRKVIKEYGRIDILVNNAGVHYENKDLLDLKTAQLRKTFETNIYSFFWITQSALPFMREGSTIINTSSVTAYRGSPALMDYAATKGAIISFTRSLASNLVKKGIRVNAVAPGPVWTPLIPSTMPAKKTAEHGSDAPMQRAGEPVEIAPCYLFLASEDASYISGQVLHPNGGEIVNG